MASVSGKHSCGLLWSSLLSPPCCWQVKQEWPRSADTRHAPVFRAEPTDHNSHCPNLERVHFLAFEQPQDPTRDPNQKTAR